MIKLSKVTYEYSDGTIKTLEGEQIDKYDTFINQVCVLANQHDANPNWDSLEWNVTPGEELKKLNSDIEEALEYYD